MWKPELIYAGYNDHTTNSLCRFCRGYHLHFNGHNSFPQTLTLTLTLSGACRVHFFKGWLALTHRGREMHICISNLTIITSDNGLSPDRCQAIIWTNGGILLIGPLGTNCCEMLIIIHTFSFKKMQLKMLWEMEEILSRSQRVKHTVS